MINHVLKTESQYFWDIVACQKRFEVRLNDRDFRVGNILNLCEIDNRREFTGFRVDVKVEYILVNGQKVGIRDGYTVLGVSEPLTPVIKMPVDVIRVKHFENKRGI